MGYNIETVLFTVLLFGIALIVAYLIYNIYSIGKSTERGFRLEAMNADSISATKEEDEEQKEKIFDVENIKTLGNHSWIPAFDDCSDYPHEVPGQILLALAYFSISHPQLEVLSFIIESGNTCMDGIWITHRLKV